MNDEKGITRRVDPLGRLVIPKEIRRALFIHEEDLVDIVVKGDTVVVKKHYVSCCFCDCKDISKIVVFRDKKVCTNCINSLQNVK